LFYKPFQTRDSMISEYFGGINLHVSFPDVAVILFPLVIVAVVGISGYLIYRLVLYDYLCNRSVNVTLRKYDIKKTQFQIIKEYHESKGEKITDKEISQLEKHYRQHEPEQFLAMYDATRDKSKNNEES